MLKFEEDKIIIERSKTSRALYLVGACFLMLLGASGLILILYLSSLSSGNTHQLRPFALLFMFPLILGCITLIFSRAHKLTLHCASREFTEEHSRFGVRSVRTGLLSDFSAVKLSPMKNKELGCSLNLVRRNRLVFPITLGTYFSYETARQDLQRLSAATGIPAVDCEGTGMSNMYNNTR